MKTAAVLAIFAGMALATPVENVQATAAVENAQSMKETVNSFIMEQLAIDAAGCFPGCFDWCIWPLKEREDTECPKKFRCCT